MSVDISSIIIIARMDSDESKYTVYSNMQMTELSLMQFSIWCHAIMIGSIEHNTHYIKINIWLYTGFHHTIGKGVT